MLSHVLKDNTSCKERVKSVLPYLFFFFLRCHHFLIFAFPKWKKSSIATLASHKYLVFHFGLVFDVKLLISSVIITWYILRYFSFDSLRQYCC